MNGRCCGGFQCIVDDFDVFAVNPCGPWYGEKSAAGVSVVGSPNKCS